MTNRYGFIKHGNAWKVFRCTNETPGEFIGVIEYDRSTNLYTAFDATNHRLDHPSGRAKHFCRQTDAAEELDR